MSFIRNHENSNEEVYFVRIVEVFVFLQREGFIHEECHVRYGWHMVHIEPNKLDGFNGSVNESQVPGVI